MPSSAAEQGGAVKGEPVRAERSEPRSSRLDGVRARSYAQRLGSSLDDAICSTPGQLALEPLEETPGCRMRLGGGRCMSIHAVARVLLCAKRSSGASRRPQVAGGSGALVFAAEGLGLRPCSARCTARSLALGHGKRPSRSTWQGEWLLDPAPLAIVTACGFPPNGAGGRGRGRICRTRELPGRNGVLAVSYGFHCAAGQIAKLELDGRPLRILTPRHCPDGRWVDRPSWSADGRRVIFGYEPWPITVSDHYRFAMGGKPAKLDAHVGAGPGPPAGRAVPRRPCRSRGGHRPCRCAPAATCAGQPGRGTAEQTSVGGPRRRATRLSLPRRTGVSSAA